jgi:hypothetical protein
METQGSKTDNRGEHQPGTASLLSLLQLGSLSIFH